MKGLDFIFPPACVVCRRDLSAELALDRAAGFRFRYAEPIYHRTLCGECFDKIRPYELRCQVCAIKNSTGRTCLACQSQTPIERFLVAAPYSQDMVQRVVQTYKYNLIKSLALPFGLLLSETLGSALENSPRKKTLIMPIPLHPRRLRWRGFNQSRLLAEFLSQEFSLNCLEVLKRVKTGPPLAKIPVAERRTFIKDAFQIIEIPKETQRLVIVDDVIGSRATLDEAGRTLRAGAPKLELWALTIAA